MKLLIAIPVLMHGHIFENSINSVLNNTILKGIDVDVLVGDNGSSPDVKEVLKKYEGNPRVTILTKPQNIYVNPIWNEFMYYFMLRGDYDYLAIMNSDLYLQKDWAVVCKKYWEVHPNDILIPKMVQDPALLNRDENTDVMPAQEVHAGTAGVFITMNREQCEAVYPIPDNLKIWYGDNWIFEISRAKYKTVIPENLVAYHFHGGSQTVGCTPNVSPLIEDDKVIWETVQDLKQEKIKQLLDATSLK